MALTEITYTGDGTDVTFGPIPFEYLEDSDINITLDGTPTVAFTIDPATKIITFSSAPANGVSIRVYRLTSSDSLSATFISGSAIRAQDLNNNFKQNLYVTQEVNNYSLQDIGNVTLNANYTFSGTVSGSAPTANSHLVTKQYVDALAFSGTGISDGNKGDITISSSGSVWTIDNDAVTTSKIADGNVTSAKLSFTPLESADIGVTVQGYDADTAKLDVAQTFTAVQTFTSPVLTTPSITDPTITGTILEDVYTISDGAAFEVDPGNGSVQLITLGASRTPKATNFAAGESVTLMVDDGTAYTITWTDTTWGPSGVIWTGGSAPTLATSGYTVIQLWKVGSQVYGATVGDVA